MQIDGALTGKKLDISNRNMARVIAASLSPQAHNAVFDQRFWSVSATVTPAAANAEFFYFKNNHTRLSYALSRLNIRNASSETITLARVTGTATSTTDITPVNRVLGNGNLPTATVAGGTNIGGLTPGLTIEQWTGTVSPDFDLTSRPIIISPGTAVALSAAAGSIAVSYIVDFYTLLVEVPEF